MPFFVVTNELQHAGKALNIGSEIAGFEVDNFIQIINGFIKIAATEIEAGYFIIKNKDAMFIQCS